MSQRASNLRRNAAIAMTAFILLAGGLYLLGNGRINLWDRDEPRYAEISREMLRSGDWVVPILLGQRDMQKPPLTDWCIIGAMKIFGVNAFAARFHSVVAMLGVLVLLGIAIFQAIGPKRALFTLFILGTSLLVIYDSKQCLTDAILLLWITIAQLCFYAMYRGKGSWLAVVIFWSAEGLAILTKGPIGPWVAIGTVFILVLFDWRGRSALAWIGRTRPVAGLIILGAVIAPWMILLHLRAPGFLSDMFGVLRQHVVQGTEQHQGPPGYHLLTVWAMFFPWSVFLPITIYSAWKNRRLPAVRFALAMALGTWIMCEMIRTKLPGYLLPAYPPLAFLTADALIRCVRRQNPWLHDRGCRIAAVIFAVVFLLLGMAPWIFALPPLKIRPQPWHALIAINIAGVICAAVAFDLMWTHRLVGGFIAAGLGTMGITALLCGAYLPSASFLHLPEQVADCLIQQGATHLGDAQMLHYKEDSVLFYQGGTLRRAVNDDLLNKNPDPAGWPRWLVLTDQIWDAAPVAARDRLEIVGTFHGLNYAGSIGGKRLITVMVVRKKDSPATR